jgi:hypothetical protein
MPISILPRHPPTVDATPADPIRERRWKAPKSTDRGDLENRGYLCTARLANVGSTWSCCTLYRNQRPCPTSKLQPVCLPFPLTPEEATKNYKSPDGSHGPEPTAYAFWLSAGTWPFFQQAPGALSPWRPLLPYPCSPVRWPQPSPQSRLDPIPYPGCVSESLSPDRSDM